MTMFVEGKVVETETRSQEGWLQRDAQKTNKATIRQTLRVTV